MTFNQRRSCEDYEKRVKHAIDDVISNKYNFTESAREYGISRSILQRRVEKFKKSFTYSEQSLADEKFVLSSKYTSNTIFTTSQERMLAEYINTYSILQDGHTYIMAQKFIFEYGNFYNIKMPDTWFKNKATGDDWIQSFIKHNAEYLGNLFEPSAGINTLPQIKAIAREPRKFITIEERVQIINEYENNPCMPSIAELFDCALFQVIIIIHDKEKTMTRYAERRASDDDEHLQKISFMEDVLYEYILRATYHNVKLCDINVKKKMCQIRNCIGVNVWYPTSFWMQQFMKKYKITGWKLDQLKEILVPGEKKEKYFEILSMVNYVRSVQTRNKVLKQINTKKYNTHIATHNLTDDAKLHDLDDMTSTELKTLTRDEDDVPPIKIHCIERFSEDILSRHQSDTGENLNIEITSHAHALKILKHLENFALVAENYRAIGLITQLEDIFRNRQKV